MFNSMLMRRRLAAILLSVLCVGTYADAGFTHEDHEDESFQLSALDKQRDPLNVITSSSVQLSESERAAGVVNLSEILPSLNQINQRYKIFNPAQFNYFVKNFHYPYRDRFQLGKQQPPTQIVLHWTANSRPDIPLHTFSAFLRSRRNGRIVERANRYKNVSNYYLTGSIPQPDGSSAAELVKLTRGELQSWGDIPRVTAYPTDEKWDDNKYDGRGAIGIEIESPNFGVFYRNPSQREKLHNFLVLVLRERGVMDSFAELRYSEHWDDMVKLHGYLKNNLAKIDVDKRGGIAQNYQQLDKLLKFLPDVSPRVYTEARKMFSYISGHGIVSREYNERMVKAGRYRDANYDKIDFTEAHVFVVAMDLLQSDMQLHGQEIIPEFDVAASRDLDFLRRVQYGTAIQKPLPAEPEAKRLPSGRLLQGGYR